MSISKEHVSKLIQEEEFATSIDYGIIEFELRRLLECKAN